MGFLDAWKTKTGKSQDRERTGNIESAKFLSKVEAHNESLPITVDRLSPEIAKAIDEGNVYRKVAEIEAQIATEPTEVRTIISGKQETTNTAMPGDYIVKNLSTVSKESYVIKAEKFPNLYDLKEGETSVYVPKAFVRAGQNPYGRPIEMMAQWGQMQNGDENCMLADTYDHMVGTREGQPRIIARDEFERTYSLVK